MIDERAKAGLARAQFLFRTLALRIVDQRTQHTDLTAELDATPMDFDGEHRPVLAQSAKLVAKLFHFAFEASPHALPDERAVLGAREIERTEAIHDLFDRVAEHPRKCWIDVRETVHVRDVNAGQRGFRQDSESLLDLGELILCLPPLGDVLHGAELAHGPPLLVPRHVALAVDHAHRAVRPYHSVLDVVARTAAHRHFAGGRGLLAVIRVDEADPAILPLRKIERLYAEDAARLVRQRDAPVDIVALPPADMRDLLRPIQATLAISQATEGDEAGERLRKAMTDLLEKALLVLCPGARVRALVQPE